MQPNDDSKQMRELDLRGLKCPLTFVHLRLALEEMQPGEVLHLLIDDKLASVDLPRNAELEGHTVLSMPETRKGFWEMWLKKKL